MDKKRIIELQRQVKIAKEALTLIIHTSRDPKVIASKALDDIWPLDPKQQLQGIVGYRKGK